MYLHKNMILGFYHEITENQMINLLFHQFVCIRPIKDIIQLKIIKAISSKYTKTGVILSYFKLDTDNWSVLVKLVLAISGSGLYHIVRYGQIKLWRSKNSFFTHRLISFIFSSAGNGE